LSLSPERAAAGVLQVAQATMEEAVRVISLARGHDPSRFVLYSFGGAGGMHVAALARNLGIPGVRIPRHPGLFSALGMLASDVVLELSETVLAAVEPVRLESGYEELEQRALGLLREEGFGAGEVQLLRSADVRYHGQSYELNVPYGEEMAMAFHEEHERRYGHARADRPLQVVHLRVRAVGKVEPPRLEELEPDGSTLEYAVCGRPTVLLDDGTEAQALLLQRERLRPGVVFHGPAVIVEYSSTVWLPPGTQGSVDRWGSLVLGVKG
jgi:N-methylhydantoinase A